MKRIIVVAVALAFVLVSAGAALAGIAGGKHDMRTHLTGESTGYDEVCVYCHTPHNSNTTAQLWNRTNPTNNYTAYTSATMNNTMDTALGAGSLLCMSCHDGTIAVDSISNTPNYGTMGTDGSAILSAAKMMNAGNAFLGTSLANDHPVGITYSNTDDPDLYAVATVRTSTRVRLFGTNTDQVECASCHDAHNMVDLPFLRSSNAGSQLCLACHNK